MHTESPFPTRYDCLKFLPCRVCPDAGHAFVVKLSDLLFLPHDHDAIRRHNLLSGLIMNNYIKLLFENRQLGKLSLNYSLHFVESIRDFVDTSNIC